MAASFARKGNSRRKARAALKVTADVYPGPTGGLLKLAAFEPALSRSLLAKGGVTDDDVAAVPLPRLFDAAYAARLGRFGYLPTKSPAPFQIVTEAEIEARANATRTQLEESGMSQYRAQVEARMWEDEPEIDSLLLEARKTSNLQLTLWLAKNFAMLPSQAAAALTNACAADSPPHA